jgi:hypothetical protein
MKAISWFFGRVEGEFEEEINHGSTGLSPIQLSWKYKLSKHDIF